MGHMLIGGYTAVRVSSRLPGTAEEERKSLHKTFSYDDDDGALHEL